MTKKLIILTALILPSLFLILLSCHGDNDSPNGPVDPDEEHLFYIGSKVGNLVKVFSVEQEKFIDSFHIDALTESDSMFHLNVIGDDCKLAVSTRHNIYIYDLKTRETVKSFYSRLAIFTRDAGYYFGYVENSAHCELRRCPGHALVFTESTGTAFPKFSNDGRYLSFSDYSDRYCQIEVYDILRCVKWAHRRYLYGENIFAAEQYPHSSGKKVFFGGTT